MVEPWFPTPLYFNKVREDLFDAIQTDLQTVFDNLNSENKFSPFPREGCHRVSDTSFRKNLFEEHKLNLIQEEIDYHVSQYLLELGAENIPFMDKRTIVESWMTVTDKSQYAVVHSHGSSDISGVYYFKTNGQDGNLFFENPNKLIKNSWCFEHLNNRWMTSPQVGKIVLFPGWLEHGIEVNTTDNQRISISFNINFQRYKDLK
jgi:uncharacterized protein (TIGR02466 family)